MLSTGDESQICEGARLHLEVVERGILQAERFVWIATADLKNMHLRMARRWRPALDVFDDLARRSVSFRIVHASLPSRLFRETLENHPRLCSGHLELQICPRSHWKMVIVDGKFAYTGSANFTGAGLGAKHADRRNLEMGLVTRNVAWVKQLQAAFDAFWIGDHCKTCALRPICPDPIVGSA